MRRLLLIWLCLLLAAVPVAAQEDDDTTPTATDAATEAETETPTATQTPEPNITFGMFLVGPQDDTGWSQSHYQSGVAVEEDLNAEMLLYESVGSDMSVVPGAVADMVDQGAEVIFFTSASMEEAALEIAPDYPDVTFVQIAGDAVLTGSAPPNYSNLMAQMEWGMFSVGCAAALTTETGNIGYLAPLINNETRRLAASAYLGAEHCFEEFRADDLDTSLSFRVEWVGFWFYIPGETRNPSRLALSMFDDNYDIVISGIDTPEALEVANRLYNQGETVYASAYNNTQPCQEYTDVCIGAAVYSWQNIYAEVLTQVQNGTWSSTWEWVPPDWNRFGLADQSPVSFVVGGAFPPGNRAFLRQFIFSLEDYATNHLVPASFPMWQGLIRLQDGTVFANEDELVNMLDVWYLPQLLEGMQGESFPFQLQQQ